jgi:polyhydroxybutyrate depolymerase
VCATLLLASAAVSAAETAGTLSVTTVDGPRTALITRAPGSSPAPVVIVLHGGFGSGAQMRSYMSWDRIAREHGITVVYPDGLDRRWNDARPGALRKLNPSKTDDVGFMRHLAETLIQSKVADPTRIYVTGLSNGGHMTHRLACEAGDLFAAGAAVIANLAEGLAARCTSRPIPMLLMNGTDDKLTPYAGEPAKNKQEGGVLSAPDTFAFFARRNGCKGAASETKLPDAVQADNSTVTVTAGQGCTHDTKLYRINGGGHTAPARDLRAQGFVMKRLLGVQNQDIDAAEEIWAFFKDKRRP